MVVDDVVQPRPVTNLKSPQLRAETSVGLHGNLPMVGTIHNQANRSGTSYNVEIIIAAGTRSGDDSNAHQQQSQGLCVNVLHVAAVLCFGGTGVRSFIYKLSAGFFRSE